MFDLLHVHVRIYTLYVTIDDIPEHMWRKAFDPLFLPFYYYQRERKRKRERERERERA